MNIFSLFLYVAMGAALAGAGIVLLQRRRRRTLRCIAPYLPAAAGSAPQAPKP
ncbi:MAG: LPXTG cell wall anchor domain-containing protein [Giesbergeria sp.]|jgi:LPXTG-motif cell wall-anchored protein|nr:LPXTG cell wall anchor domain-containing protein [Simplicispira sp.]MBP6118016.1 LPXTG cell wall anchor domain-containing protein [Giesbergeria sp.]MBP6160638.1 LPXTG cell wall anchor domain-containing protein [Giesbergeria sp.]MBP7084162.1 LPXTG cell wall anchor domain-containing protein [Giesbergeria sp.]MBP9784592.1 LPXTG cell wall anchor domain-containing protein [Giesbergeria sp.]